MSKPFITFTLLAILISACTAEIATFTPPTAEGQITANTIESLATITATPLIVAATEQPLPTLEAICPGASVPHVAIGQHVTVMVDNIDKLKLRFQPKASPNTVKRELDKFTQLRILEGPVCAYSAETQTSYWFWMVAVLLDGEQGWVAEGDASQYFIE